MFRPSHHFPRARRLAVQRHPVLTETRIAVIAVRRARKGFLALLNAAWRRCDTGSNHISAFGVWRGRARRATARVNRTGETRWRRLPLISQQAIFEKGTS